MKALAHAVLRTLADGEFHSGATLAAAAGMSRASVWHAIRELEAGGLTIYKVRSRGYRLSAPVDVLDQARIVSALGALAPRFELDVRGAVVSTSTALLEAAAQGAPTGRVIVAEVQSAGRGRLGRPWVSGIGASLTFSLLWRFERGAGWLGGLSLAVGIAVARVLREAGARDVGLKWPNDVLWHGCKLAGILIEMHGEAQGPSAAVIGIGLNIRLPEALRAGIDQPVTDLERACGAAVERNALLAALLAELAAVLDGFASNGLAPLRDAWLAFDLNAGREVTLRRPDGSAESGIAQGIAEDGALLLATSDGVRRYHSGEVSLRARPRTRDSA